MHSSTTGERITAALSTLVAIAILGAAVTAEQARAPAGDQIASLESDLRFQLDLAFRDNARELRRRTAELDGVMEAWRLADPTADNDRRLADWLEASIRASMPGGAAAMPPGPVFVSDAPPEVADNPSPNDEVAEAPTPAAVPMEDVVVADPAVEGGDAAPTDGEAPLVPVAADDDGASTPFESDDDQSIEPDAPLDTAELGSPPPEPGVPPGEHSIATAELPADSDEETPAPVDGEARIIAISPTPAPAPPPVVRINLAELDARVSGYHQGIDEITATVVAGDRLTPPRLDALVSQVEQLASQHQFLELYYYALTPAERRRVTEPRSPAEIVDLVSRYVSHQAGNDDFLAEFDAEQDNRPTLAQRLQAVADAVAADDASR